MIAVLIKVVFWLVVAVVVQLRKEIVGAVQAWETEKAKAKEQLNNVVK